MVVNDLGKWKFGHLKVLELLIHYKNYLTVKSDDLKWATQVMECNIK